jgi:MFS family permease
MDQARTIDTPAPAEATPMPTGSAWAVVWALSLASMVAYIDRQVLTLLFAPLKADLQLSDTEVSLLVGFAFVVCYAVFGLVSGWLADRYSRKGLVSWGIAIWSAATCACGAANSFATLFAARMLVGTGESTLSPAAMSMVTDAFPREKLARAMSVYTAASFVGMGMAMVLGGVGIGVATQIVESGAPVFGSMRPWQVSFVLVGAIGGLAVLPMLLIKEPPRGGRAAPAAPKAPLGGPPLGRFLRANAGAFGFIWIGYSLNAMSGVGTMSWTPTYFMRIYDLTAPQIGLMYGGIVAIVGLIGVMTGPTVFEWLKRRGMRDGYIVFPMICFALGAIPSIIAFSVDSLPLALGLIGFKQLIMTLPMPIMAMSMQIIAPPQLRGRMSAIYLFMGNILAAAIGPVTVAVFTDHLYRDENLLGMSIITNTLIMVPLAATCLWLAIKPYRTSLADADAGFVRTY